jgi:ATP synthase protein I
VGKSSEGNSKFDQFGQVCVVHQNGIIAIVQSFESPSENTNAPAETGESSQTATPETSASPVGGSMQEYYQLKQNLLLWTLVLTAIIFVAVWMTYNLNIALNYFIGACIGVIYLRMLAKDVEALGGQKIKLSKTRFVPLIGAIVLASQWNQLQILPIFLGFVTYKAAIIGYTLTSLLPDR